MVSTYVFTVKFSPLWLYFRFSLEQIFFLIFIHIFWLCWSLFFIRRNLFLKIIFMYFWLRWVLVAGGELSLAMVNGGYSLVVECGFLPAGLLLLQSEALECVLRSWGTWLSCSTACRVLLNQGSNLHLLHWQVNSLALIHQGSQRGNL